MLHRPPHPTLEFADLVPAASERRLSSLPGAAGIQYFFNARAALFHIFLKLRSLGRRRVLLPAFHCVSVVEPALRAGMQVAFYRIDRHLGIDADDLMSAVSNDVAAVLFINYFGMPARFEPLLDELHARGVTSIEDCSHSFLLANPLSLAGGRANLSVYSFWKLVPSGVGGGLLSATPFSGPTMTAPPVKDSMVRAKRLFEEALLARGADSGFARWYARVEAARVRRRRAMTARAAPGVATTSDPAREFDERSASTRFPWLARRIVDSADLHEIVAARRRNYAVYARRLARMSVPASVLPDLPDRVCPWAYPVIVPDRSRHDQELRRRGVPVWTFGNVLHAALHGAASPAAIHDALHLADNLLCLPVHQGIAESHANEFAATVLDHFEETIDHAC